MYLSPMQTFIMILAIALGTFLTRGLPFLLFPEGKEAPPVIHYLGTVLPYAMIGLLVVYCLKDIQWATGSFGIPEGISILCIIGLHQWKNNTLLSIAAGTAVYMVLMQTLFV